MRRTGWLLAAGQESLSPAIVAMSKRIRTAASVLEAADDGGPQSAIALAAVLRSALAHPFTRASRGAKSGELVLSCFADARDDLQIGAKSLAAELDKEEVPVRSVRFATPLPATGEWPEAVVPEQVWLKNALAGPENLPQLLWHELEAASVGRMLRTLSDPTLESARAAELLGQLKESGMEVATFADAESLAKEGMSDAHSAAAVCGEGGVLKWRVFASPLLIHAQEVLFQRAFADVKWVKLSVSLHRLLWAYANDSGAARRIPAIGLDRMPDEFAHLLPGEAGGTVFDMKAHEASLASLKGTAAEKD